MSIQTSSPTPTAATSNRTSSPHSPSGDTMAKAAAVSVLENAAVAAAATTATNTVNPKSKSEIGLIMPTSLTHDFFSATTPAVTTAPPLAGSNYFSAKVDSFPFANRPAFNLTLPMSNEKRKRPTELDLSAAHLNIPPLANTSGIKNGLRTPNSASSAVTSFPKSYIDPSSSPGLHAKHRSPSLPSNNIGSIEVPKDVTSISPKELDDLMTANVSPRSDNSSETEINNVNHHEYQYTQHIRKQDEDGDEVMGEDAVDGLPSPPSSLMSSSTYLRNSSTSSSSNSSLASDSQIPPVSVLIVDIRSFRQFSMRRIKGAHNICIPTTLLKRKTFSLTTYMTHLTAADSSEFNSLDTYREIILYDDMTRDVGLNPAMVNTIWKFSKCEQIVGRIRWLWGGIVAMEGDEKYRHLIDRNQREIPASNDNANQTPPLHTAPGPSMNAGMLNGFCLPEASIREGPMQAFRSNIRTAMEVYDEKRDVIDVKLPLGVEPNHQENGQIFPNWLCDIINESKASKIIGKKFTEIEMAEKERLQNAFGNTQGTRLASGQRSASLSEASPLGTESVSTHKQSKSMSSSTFEAMTLAGVELGNKNRYNNIWPFDHSRVRLRPLECDSPTADYINASRISTALSNKRYIATQGPLPATFKDFWKLIFDERIPVILMLTPEQEGGLLKCHPYWLHDGQFGSIYLKQVKQELVPLTPSSSSSSTVMIRRFELTDANKRVHTVVQVQYTEWPDLGSPASATDLLALGRMKERFVVEVQQQNGDKVDTDHPVVVHCSAGCGRTGTFCTVDTVVDIFKTAKARGQALPQEDIVYKVVHDFRKQRLSMVQNMRQYAMCYESIIEWCIQNRNGLLSA